MRKIAPKLKGKFCRTIFRLVMFYTSEYWPMNQSRVKKVQVLEMRMTMLDGKKVNTSEVVRDIGQKIEEIRLRSLGHLVR